MKRMIALLCTVAMAISIYACEKQEPKHPSEAPGASKVSESASQAVSSTSGTKEDMSSQGKQKGVVKIEITPPEGWTPVEGSVLPVQYMKGTASLMVKAEPFDSATLDDMVNEALENFQKSFDNLKVQGEIEPFTVDEKDARKLTFTCTVGKMNMKYLYVYLFAADKAYAITFGDQESTFNTLASDYETILSNIKFKAQ